MSELNNAKAELINYLADSLLILGHRNGEWTGIGPVIEEDIAFGSMAQDKVGQARQLYELLHSDFGYSEPDTFAFTRTAEQFKCPQLVELPIGDYAFSLMRHFLFDQADLIRFEMLSSSSFIQLNQFANKFKGEIKYHVFHANTWIKQLSKATDESKIMLQTALDALWPYAFAMFEPGPNDALLIENGVFDGEKALYDKWFETISTLLNTYQLNIPNISDETIGRGGRYGYHTEYLQPLLTEMTEVFTIDPSAEW